MTENSLDATSRSPNAIPSSQQTEKATPQGSSPPALPNDTSSPTPSAPVIPNSQTSALPPPDGTLPPQLLSFYTSLKSNLTNSFSDAPPYTVQRLAELILQPTTHYRTLPAYLRALDRTISVSSNSDVFPLPSSALDAVNASSNGTPVAGGLLAPTTGPNHGDDFNGAALTRIPWLRDSASMLDTSERPPGGGTGVSPTTDLRTESTSMIDGPNGAGSIETVTVAVNGVPSAGLSAQQRVPSASADSAPAPLQPSGAATASVTDAPQPQESGGAALPRSPRAGDEEEEERPHARGPEEIGMEDMGPQAYSPDSDARSSTVGPAASLINAEKAMGRPGEGEIVGGEDDKSGEATRASSETLKEGEDGVEADAEADADAMSLDELDKENKT